MDFKQLKSKNKLHNKQFQKDIKTANHMELFLNPSRTEIITYSILSEIYWQIMINF